MYVKGYGLGLSSVGLLVQVKSSLLLGFWYKLRLVGVGHFTPCQNSSTSMTANKMLHPVHRKKTLQDDEVNQNIQQNRARKLFFRRGHCERVSRPLSNCLKLVLKLKKMTSISSMKFSTNCCSLKYKLTKWTNKCFISAWNKTLKIILFGLWNWNKTSDCCLWKWKNFYEKKSHSKFLFY